VKTSLARALFLSALATLPPREILAADLDDDDWDGETTSGSADTSDDASSDESDDEGGPRPSPFELSLGLKMYSRAFRYTDTLAQLDPDAGYPSLITYNLDAAPLPALEGSYFPFTGSKSKVLQGIGLTGSFEIGIGTGVNLGALRFDQTHYRLFLGLRGRYNVGPITLNPLLGFGAHEFSLSDSNGIQAPFPNLSYSLLEMGLGAEWRADPFVLRGQGRLLLPLGLGGIKDATWFPEASGIGAHFGGQLGFILSERFTLFTTVDVRTYGLDFNPIAPGSPVQRIAGGAVDRYISVGLAIEYRIPEKASASASISTEGSSGSSSDDFDDFDSFD
jgi:hypothetical protein